MAKESLQPKAVNIIRPSVSTRRTPSVQSEPIPLRPTVISKAPKIAASVLSANQTPSVKHQLNIYHPPSRLSSSSTSNALHDRKMATSSSPSRPTVQSSERMTKSFTVPPRPNQRSMLNTVNASDTNAPVHRRHTSWSNVSNEKPSRKIISDTTRTSHLHNDAMAKSSPTEPTKTLLAGMSVAVDTTAGRHLGYLPENNSSGNALHGPLRTRSNSVSSTSSDHSLSSHSSHSSSDSSHSESSTKDHLNPDTKDDTDDINREPSQNEARIHRKIADLEISNRSLLAVNSMLEATVRRQASEVSRLRKQMRQDGIEPTPEPIRLEVIAADEEDDEEWQKDALFQRLCRITDTLIEEAQDAVAYEFQGLGRVLHHDQGFSEDFVDEPEHDLSSVSLIPAMAPRRQRSSSTDASSPSSRLPRRSKSPLSQNTS